MAIPYTFTAGTTIVSDQMDANFAVCLLTQTAGTVTVTHTYTVTQTFTGGWTSAAACTITSASATAFAVGLAGATNPAFVVDSSTGSQAAGLKVTGATAAGTVAVAVISSGTDANLTLNALGTGTIGIGSVSTGRVTITPVVTITGALTQTGLATFNGGATITSGQTLTVTGATITGLTAASVGAGTFSGGSYAFTGATTLTGGAGNMTVVAGTGNSRTLILQGTSSGGVATTNVTLSDTTAVFNNIALSGITTLAMTPGSGALTINRTVAQDTRLVLDGTAGSGAFVQYQSSGTNRWRLGRGAGTGNDTFELYDYGAATQAITVTGTTMAVAFAGALSGITTLITTAQITSGAGIQTSAPTGGAGVWELGIANAVSPTSPNRTLTVEIGGTAYYIHAKTTND